MRRDRGRTGRFHGILLAVSLAALLIRSGAAEAGDLDVVISEIHYHPAEAEAVDEGDEFIELQNPSDVAVDIYGWFLDGGIIYVFPKGATLAPHGFAVIAKDAARVAADYGLSGVYGNYEGRLSNSGDRVTLRDAAGNLVDRVDYRDDAPWPENPDGLGPSLEKTTLARSGQDPSSWRASIPLGGTPGRPNSTADERAASLSLIAKGAPWRYRKGTAEPATPVGAWAATGYNDSSWSSGPSGFGYGDNDDATVLSDMEGEYATVYLRKKFDVPSLATIGPVRLSIIYDDAYVAYLNGTEVRRSATAGGTPGTPLPHDARAADTHENIDGVDDFDLRAFGDLLHEGQNVLAIQVLNESSGSSDLSLIPAVAAVLPAGPPAPEPAHDVELNEVCAGDGVEEGFIELHNEGAGEADLSGYKLVHSAVGAGGHVFPEGTKVAAGARLRVPASVLPFTLVDGAQWFGLVTPDLRFVDGVRTRARPKGAPWGRYPDGDGDTFVLATPTPGGPNTVTLQSAIVIDEVQYHPPTSAATAEYIELHNRGDQPVDVALWQIDNAVKYVLPPSTVIPAGGYVVISGDPAAVEARHGISGVLGPWTGHLAGGAEKIELLDALGNRVDVVHYADDGRWPTSTEISGPDGFGPSVELVNPGTENNHGSAWLASTGTGTPGAQNSRHTGDPAPILRSVEHSPTAPRSTEEVTVTARVADERGVASVVLLSQPDGSGSFTQLSMLDDGLHGDGAAGDGLYGAKLPPRPDGTVMQFYLEATDTTGHARRFPAEAPAHVCLYQVDDFEYPEGVPLYRAVLRQADLTELVNRDLQSDVLLDGTFVHGSSVTYDVGIRYRGEHSRNFWVKSFRIQFTDDEPFEDVTDLDLNAQDSTVAHMAADFFRRADMPVFQTAPVAYTLNKSWEASHGGIYLRVEAVNGDFVARQFAGDEGGNLYRAYDAGIDEGDLSYKGSSPSEYSDIYVEKTNQEVVDHADIIALTNTFTNASDASFATAIANRIDVPQWIRYFAVQTVLNNQDGCISTNVGEDYFIYRRPSDSKWVIIPWDQNEDFQDAGDGIFRMQIDAVSRLVEHPDFLPLYYESLRQLLDGPFRADVMQRQADSVSFVLAQVSLEWIVDYVPERQAQIRTLLPPEPDMPFVRGDGNADGTVDISDGTTVLLYLFGGGVTPPCLDALDANDNGAINLTDAIHVLGFLFQSGPAPPPPFPSAGRDPTSTDPYVCTGP